jgi:hypothetical protein
MLHPKTCCILNQEFVGTLLRTLWFSQIWKASKEKKDLARNKIGNIVARKKLL